MAKISLWIGEGCLSSGITTLIDAFSIANLWYASMTEKRVSALFDTEIITTSGNPVVAYGNIRFEADCGIRDVKKTDCIIISPHIPNTCPLPDGMSELSEWLIEQKKRDITIASVCTGSFILAETGLLDGRKATTNWQYARLFQKMYPQVKLHPEYMMTEDSGVICTGAATAVHNLAIHLIKTYGSQKLATVCSKALLVDPNRYSQVLYTIPPPPRNHGDQQVLAAQKQFEENYASIELIDEIASDVGISPRHFKRRFKKATGEMPLKYLQRVRIEAAKEKLETTQDSISDIIWSVGYKDISSFTRLFKQHARLSPKAYRDKFYHPVLW